MSRYIDAEPLEHRSPKLKALILEQPTADVEPVRHGYWDNDMECSICGCLAPVSHVTGEEYAYEYCPNCGAKMDGKEQENGDI